MVWNALRATLVAGALAGATSCGSESPQPSAALPAPSAPRTPFTVWVLDEPLGIDGIEEPIAAARVAFDPAGGGERITKTTEADGHVTFDADFHTGGGSVTVLSDGHVYTTMLEVSPETARARPNSSGKPASDLVVFPARLDPLTASRTVELRGTITGKRDPLHVVSLAASGIRRLGAAQALEAGFVLRAPKGRPFFLLGHETKTLVDREGVIVDRELVKSFRLDLPARADDQIVDLDLASLAALPSRVIEVRAEPPPTFGAGTKAFAAASSADSGLAIGLFGRARAEGTAFAIDVGLVESEIAPERLLVEAVLTAPDGSSSARTEAGALAEGMVFRDFLEPPAIADPDASRTLRDPIPIERFAPGAELVARVYAAGRLVWVLHGPPGGLRGGSFVIPYRDEVESADIQVFALSLTALADRVALAPRGAIYRRTATFRDVRLRKR